KASEVGGLSLDEELSRVGSIAVSTRQNGQKTETDEPIEKCSGAPRRDARLLRQSLDRVGPRLNVREDGMVDGGGQDRESPAARGHVHDSFERRMFIVHFSLLANLGPGFLEDSTLSSRGSEFFRAGVLGRLAATPS